MARPKPDDRQEAKKIIQEKYRGSPKGKITYRKQYLKKYGITPEEYDELYSRQGGRCAICGIHQSELSTALCVDHDHETGKIRGLLCKLCNFGIGFLGTIENLSRAKLYLEVCLG